MTRTNIDDKHEDMRQRRHMTNTPKVVTFQEEKNKPIEQKPESTEKEFGHGKDEEVIKFVAGEDNEDSISGLSRSIGKYGMLSQ